MVILNSRKIIYIHIHKTGGESIEHSLGTIRAWNDIVVGAEHRGMTQEFDKLVGLSKHSSALEVATLLGPDAWKDYFSWSTVRNPYARMASYYSYVASITEPELSIIGFPLDRSAVEQRNWIESPNYSLTDQWAFAGVRAYLATRASPRPFSEFIRHPLLRTDEPAYLSQFSRLSNGDRDALLITRAVKLESLSSAWPQLCRDMCVPSIDLAVKNVTPNKWRRTAEELFTKAADVELMNTVYADDFRWFNYETVGKDPVARVVVGPQTPVTKS
jgi:hypothetical protein